MAPGGIPGLGHVVTLLRGPLDTVQAARSVGEVAEIRLGPFRVLVVNSPELIRRLLVQQAKEFGRGRLMTKAGEYLGKGVLCSDGDFHLRQRRLAQPAFHRTRLTGYATTMAERCAAAIDSWRPGQRIDWYRRATSLVSDIVGSTLISGEQGRQIAEAFHSSLPAITRDFMWQVASPARWLERLPTSGNRRMRSLFERLGRVVEEAVVAERARAAEPGCLADRGDLLSMLVAARDADTGERMSAEQVRSEMMNILIAAIETTSSTLAWLFYEIGRNPEVERQLHAEVDAVAADRPVALDDLPALAYTRRVIDETLRLHHPNWLLMRRARTDTDLGGFSVPAGRQIVFSPLTLHRDPALYPDPMRFDPDRWNTPPAGGAFLPFIAGRHKCLGEQFAVAEMTIAVATVAARWRLLPLAGSPPREFVRTTVQPDAVVMELRPRS